MHGRSDVLVFLQGLVPCRPVTFHPGGPRPARQGLDGLNGDAAPLRLGERRLEIRSVGNVIGGEPIVGHQDRVEREPIQRAPMHGGDGPAVPRDADMMNQAFLARLDRGVERPAGRQGLLPFVGMKQRVQLNQVDVIRPQSVQGSSDLVARGSVVAPVDFCGQEKFLAVSLHPRADSQFRVPIAWRRVDVIDPVFEQ